MPAADTTGQKMPYHVSVHDELENAPLDSGDEVNLTESGWREKCKCDWNNESNGCADMKAEKKPSNEECDDDDNRNVDRDDDNNNDNDESDDDSNCRVDKTNPRVNRNGEEYKFNLHKENAKCRSSRNEKYQYGQYDSVNSFSKCADKCVKKGPSNLLEDALKGYDWDCKNNKCQCLYQEGYLGSREYEFDRTNTDGIGEGSISKSKNKDNWYCAKLSGAGENLLDVQVSRRALRGGM